MNTYTVRFPSAARPLVLRSFALACLCSALSAGAVDYLWFGSDDTLGGAGTWGGNNQTTNGRWRVDANSDGVADNTTNLPWTGGNPAIDFTQARAVFAGTGAAVSLGGAISLNRILFQTSGYTIQTNTITLTGLNPTVTVNGTSANAATISSVLTGGAGVGLIKDGGGTLTLTAVNTYTGMTTVNGGKLVIGGASDLDVINRASAVTINNGAILDLGNYSEDTGIVTLTNGTITGGTNGALGVNTTAALSGAAFDLRSGSVDAILQNPKYPTGTDSATVGLTKSTDGIVTLSKVNTYTGATTLTGGSLALTNTGAIATASTVTVNSGATFAGIGAATNRAPVVVNRGGHLSPGSLSGTGVSSIGILNTGAQTWNAGGIYDWQIGALTGTAGTNWDLVSLSGLTINATGTDKFILNVSNLGVTLPATGSYSWAIATLSSGTLAAISNLNSRFQINLPAAWTADAYRFSITQVNNGNSLYLTMAVPEPATYALLLGVGTIGFIGFRHWRRSKVRV